MPFSNPGPCNVPLTQIAGTGFNTVATPATQGAEYKSITEQLLYEIWQTLLLLLAGQNPPGMTFPITFTIGDGQAGTPLAGTTSLHAAVLQGQNLADKLIIVMRNGINLNYTDATTHRPIKRFNDHVNGGFDFDPAYNGGPGLTFQNGEDYLLFVVGSDTTIAP